MFMDKLISQIHVLLLGVCRVKPFFPISALFSKINARNINYIAALNF